MQPVGEHERYRVLDVLRGLALFGVLLVNLLGAFRISLFEQIVGARVESGWVNPLIEQATAVLVEFKAFAIFSFLFGVGAAIQSERAATRGMAVRPFLARRFAILFAFGLAHIVFIWNGDILALYGICGLLLVPLIKARTWLLGAIGVGLIVIPYVAPLPIPWPSMEAMRAQAADATRVYAQGGVGEIFLFRCREAWGFMMPLWLGSLPRTAGLMALGVAAWRAGILRGPERHRTFLLCVLVAGIGIGLTLKSSEPLAAGYVAAILLWLKPARVAGLAALGQCLAALGQMALTNYLMQSVVLSFVFYGFGLGLFGKLDSVQGLGIVIVLYGAQVAFSLYWLKRFRFGPCEWLWRSLTYGQWQANSR
ncbi:MAG: DUF418 domain-containing protein [Bryobacteraceae bacterium]